jgi:diacylglycerol kinase family enzyme
MPEHEVARRRSGPVALVLSSHSGHAHATHPRELLEAAGVRVALELPVGALDHVSPQGRTWQGRGLVAAVAGGGDGTIAAVATQIAGTDLALGILPLGTSNDVARSLGLPMDLDRAVEIIAAGMSRKVDAGLALPAVTEPLALAVEQDTMATARQAALAQRGAYFLHALTLGLNVEFARLATDVARRKRFGPLNYAAAAIEAVAHAQMLPVTLRLSGVRHTSAAAQLPDAAGNLRVTHHALQVAAVNLPVFGGALNLRMPEVTHRDGLLDVVVFEALEDLDLGARVEHWLTALRGLPEGGEPASERAEADLFSLPGVLRYQAEQVVIETPQPVDVTLDGELRAATPVLVCAAPRLVRVLLPPDDETKR